MYSFCALAHCADGAVPVAGLITDGEGNLFGTTLKGGANNFGTVFEIKKTASGYASTATILYSFCQLANCGDGAESTAGLIADAAGNLFGTTLKGGANFNPNTGFGVLYSRSARPPAATRVRRASCTASARSLIALMARLHSPA